MLRLDLEIVRQRAHIPLLRNPLRLSGRGAGEQRSNQESSTARNTPHATD
jgi:hypothetical protein